MKAKVRRGRPLLGVAPQFANRPYFFEVSPVIPAKSIGRSDAFARICRYPACLGMRENFSGENGSLFHAGAPGGAIESFGAALMETEALER